MTINSSQVYDMLITKKYEITSPSYAIYKKEEVCHMFHNIAS